MKNLEATAMCKYEIILHWSDDDGVYVAEAPELPGCMADGPTAEDAVQNAEQAIREWLATATELGRPVPEPQGRLRHT